MKNQQPADNWASLLSDLGIEEPVSPFEQHESPRENPPVHSESPISTEKETENEKVKTEITEGQADQTAVAPAPMLAASAANQTMDAPEGFGAGLFEGIQTTATSDTVSEAVSDEQSGIAKSDSVKSEKRSFLARFPKINFFSSSTKETLDAVVENVKSPSLGGKSFTSNTLEKMPQTADRSSRKTPLPPRSEAVSNETVPSEPISADPWSQIASQVGALSSGSPASKSRSAKQTAARQPETESSTLPVSSSHSSPDSQRGRGRKRPPSMFDEIIPESEESRTLKNLIDSPESQTFEEEQRLQTIFGSPREPAEDNLCDNTRNRSSENVRTEKTNEKPRGRRTNQAVSRDLEQDDHRRPHRNGAAPNADKKAAWSGDEGFGSTLDATTPDAAKPEEPRVRGRRGSRYVDNRTVHQNVDRHADHDFDRGSKTRATAKEFGSDQDVFEDVSAWDIEPDSQPVERGRRARGSRSDSSQRTRKQSETRTAAPEEASANRYSSWDDAIGSIVTANIAKRGQQQRSTRRR